ncbi:MAG: VWA domain-containing protein [Nanoarchaeota archaeon]|nr:VWA domain-containing protein [Nanoarchaeota archaeon]
MINIRDKKVAIPLGIIALILIVYFISGLFGKPDDWQYSHTSAEQGMVYVAIFAGILVLSWLVISIFLIIKGKPNITPDGIKIMNPKRLVGIVLLTSPIIFVILTIIAYFIAMLMPSYGFIFISIIPIIFIGFIIWLIIYSIRNSLKVIGITIAFVLFILFLIIPLIAYFGVLSPDKFMATTGISSMSKSLSGGVSDSIGFSVGGAKDIDNFRKNIENDYLPLPTDITYEGLYYDYFFDTGETEVCQKLFCPSYNYALSKDPLSKEDEYYLQVGLNSGIKESDFKRKKLNLVIVLDISGSMSSPFNRYHYDQFSNRELREEEEDEDAGKSKMKIASKAVVGLLDHLNEGDRFGMVLFESGDYLGKPLNDVGETNMNAIKGHILELAPRGGTNFEAGYIGGTKLFEEFLDVDPEEYENRIIFLTDAMPNIGSTSEKGLLGMTKANADNKIYTTFIGIGVDFNTELIDYITKIRGANYYSVHSAKDFKTRMDDEFEYMVTPLVFNLLLKLDAPGFEIEKVYGSPEANEATGEIMKVNTLFPSKKEDGQTKGGIVILKLKKIGTDNSLKLTTNYEDRSGKTEGDEMQINLPSVISDYYDNTGIRKGILLARYVNVIRNWIDDERDSYQQKKPIVPMITYEKGIVIPPDVETPILGRWERQSIPLQVSDEYKSIIGDFKDYFESESQAIGDDTLAQEVDIMEKLTK